MKQGFIEYRRILQDKLNQLIELSYRLHLTDEEIHDIYIKKQLLKELIDDLQLRIEGSDKE